MKTESFHNTTNLQGQNLQVAEAQAKSQEQIILEIFKNNPDKGYAPNEIFHKLRSVPITSIRRAISNLAKQGVLIKTEVMRKGLYHRQNYVWRYKSLDLFN